MALKVLIVDDEEPARQGLTALLARWGYDVDEAADGQEAVSKAAASLPSVVISDLVMPKMDGLELLRALNVRVLTGERVTEVRKDGVITATGRKIPAELTVWAAGIQAPEFLKDLDGLEGKNLEHVLFVSTCSNYGLIPGNVEATEDYELKPLSLYAKHKVEIEQWLLGLKGKVDYSATVLRFATAFGLSPRMRFDLTVSEFTRELYLGHELLVFDAHTWRPYCHVKDLSEAIRCVLEAKHDRVHFEVFNVGGEANNFTKQMIVDEILRQVPEGKVKYQEHGSDPRNYRVSFEKIREQLGFSIQYSVRRGVEELLGALREGLFDNVESQRCWFGNYEIFVGSR